MQKPSISVVLFNSISILCIGFSKTVFPCEYRAHKYDEKKLHCQLNKTDFFLFMFKTDAQYSGDNKLHREKLKMDLISKS